MKKKLKVSQCRKKLKGRTPFGIFQHPFCRKTRKQSKQGPFGGKKFRSRTMPKKIERGDPLVSPGNVCYAEKKNLFGLVPWANR